MLPGGIWLRKATRAMPDIITDAMQAVLDRSTKTIGIGEPIAMLRGTAGRHGSGPRRSPAIIPWCCCGPHRLVVGDRRLRHPAPSPKQRDDVQQGSYARLVATAGRAAGCGGIGMACDDKDFGALCAAACGQRMGCELLKPC